MTQENVNLTGGRLARAYSLAVAYPDNVPGYIAEIGSGMEVECTEDCFGRFFVGCLRDHALRGPSPGAVSEHAMDIAARAGAPQLGPQLAQDFLRERTDMMLLASYLEDIMSVIPDIIQGNISSYQRTTLYNAMRFVWQTAAGLVLPDFLNALRKMTFELNEWYVNNLMETVRLDYLENAWPRNAAIIEGAVEKYETAKADGDGVMITVQAALILGVTTRFMPLLGLSDRKIQSMSANLNVDLLIEWLQDNGWID